MKRHELPVIYISNKVICDSKRLDGTKENFKQAMLGLLTAGYSVAAFDKSVQHPTLVFKDTKGFEHWYDNFVRIQGWEIPELSLTEYKDHIDYFNCTTVE
jgi:hypothetical protein